MCNSVWNMNYVGLQLFSHGDTSKIANFSPFCVYRKYNESKKCNSKSETNKLMNTTWKGITLEYPTHPNPNPNHNFDPNPNPNPNHS